MRIFILRHEKRNIDNPLFDSPLTEAGLENANSLVENIEKIHFDNIYTSPFLRVLQTIYPYCLKHKKFVKVDNSLYESMDDLKFNNNNKNNTWKNLPNKYKDIIDANYISMIDNVKLRETFEEVCERVKQFIQYLIKQNKDVLIVSHQTVCNAILNYFDNSIEDESPFKMGEYKEIII